MGPRLPTQTARRAPRAADAPPAPPPRRPARRPVPWTHASDEQDLAEPRRETGIVAEALPELEQCDDQGRGSEPVRGAPVFAAAGRDHRRTDTQRGVGARAAGRAHHSGDLPE